MELEVFHKKRIQETNSLIKAKNSFQKVVVVKDDIIPWTDEEGIKYVGIRGLLRGDYPDII